MALGKPSKKTQKATGEVAPKAKSAKGVSRSRASQPAGDKLAVEATGMVSKTRRKVTAVASPVTAVAMENAVNDVVMPATEEAPKAMAASAAQSSSSVPAHETAIASEAAMTNGHAHSHRTSHAITTEAIAQRAYQYWVERGYAHGFAEEDWRRAESELKGN